MYLLSLLCFGLQVSQLQISGFSVVSHRRLGATTLHSSTASFEVETTGHATTPASNLVDDGAPGVLEDSFFECDDSVAFWRSFQSKGTVEDLQALGQILSENLVSSPPSTANNDFRRLYWLSFCLRSGYFTVNGLFGLLHHMSQDIRKFGRVTPETTKGIRGFATSLRRRQSHIERGFEVWCPQTFSLSFSVLK